MDQEKLALKTALNFINRRWYSAFQIIKKLQDRDIAEAQITEAVTFLKEKNFLNDVRYARFFIKDRLNFRPKAKFVINSELKQKGISPNDIESAWQEVNDELEVDEYQIASNLAIKKAKSCRNLDPEVRKRRIISFLARKGYNYDVIKKALAKLDQ